jgi:hypothetical protein
MREVRGMDMYESREEGAGDGLAYLPGTDFSQQRTKESLMFNFDEYQRAVMETADYDDPMYPIVSLMVEAAEFADLFVKPLLRGDTGEPSEADIIGEAGDILWNLAAALDDWNISLHEVAAFNIKKLKDRKARGVIRGKGGNR